MEILSLLSVTPIYIAILGLIFIPLTMRAALYRVKFKILIGTGDDPEMLRRIRGQANFVETVPMALILFLTMELLGAGTTWLHVLGITLVSGRISHYLGLTELAPPVFRLVGMLATLIPILVSALWILVRVF